MRKETIMNDVQIEATREWLRDLTFYDEVDFDELTPAEVERAVSRHWDGGIVDFLRTFGA
jgi:hypothetical protein